MKRVLLMLGLLSSLALGVTPAAADFRDGTLFPDTAANGRMDLGPLYVFRSPANPNNTVFVLTVSPFTGVLTPATFVKGARYDIAIDKSGDLTEDMTLRFTFGTPSAVDGSQKVVARCLPKARCRRYVLARGTTGQNIPVAGGGLLRAANQDIPDWFDQSAWDDYAADGIGTFPRPVGMAKDFYGPNGNCLAVAIEIPSSRIGPTNAVIAAWTRVRADGAQRDREGRPFTNTGEIPKLPHNSAVAPPDRRDEFNAGRPRTDVAAFGPDMKSVFQSFYSRSAVDAQFLTDALLPDVQFFQIGSPGGFGTLIGPGNFHGPFAGSQVLGNGRRFADDVHDIMLNLITNGAKPSDNVGDDNGLRVTDGSVDPVSGMTRAVAFPYIGAPSNPPGAPNP